MSQVRKLQNGGSTKPGKLIIDSRTYDMSNQKLFEDFDDYISRAPVDLKPYLGTVIPDLRSGLTVIGNSEANTNTFSKPANMSNKMWGKAEPGRSESKNRWDAIVGSPLYMLNKAIAYVNAYRPLNDYTSTETASSNKRKITSDKQNFDYNVGEDGKSHYSLSNPTNAYIIKRANDWYDYLSGAPVGEGFDDWDVSGYPNVDAIKAWYADIEKLKNPRQYWDDIIARAQNGDGTFSQDDTDFWNWMNVGLSTSADGDGDGSGGNGGGNAGGGKDKDEISALVTDKDGNVSVNPKWAESWGIDTSTKPYIITSDDDTFGSDYSNWVVYKNKLYNNNAAWTDSELGPIMQRYMAIRNSGQPENEIWDRLKEIAQWRSSGANYPLYLFDADTSNFTRGYYPFFSDPKYKDYQETDEYGTVRTGYRPIYLGDITSSYSNLPTGYRIVSYYPKKDNYSQTNWGFENPQYAVFIPEGENRPESVVNYSDETSMLNALSQYGVKKYGDLVYSNLPNATTFNEKGFAVVLQGKDTAGGDYQLLYSKDDKQYHISSRNGKRVCKVSEDLLHKILSGEPITSNEAYTGKIQSATNVYTGQGVVLPNGSTRPKGYYVAGWKLGGKINNLRKYSIGGDFQGSTSQSTITPQTIEAPFERPAQLSTNWNDW